jgi:hypothetical protein
MEKTRNYDMFKFTDDNRANGVDRPHVNKLKDSISKHNMLHLRPIIVDKNMNIIDGQHRLTAAKELGIEVFYTVEESMNHEDIPLMQVAKSWGFPDFHNYYCKHHYPEYLKLDAFMKKHNLSLSVALSMLQGSSKTPRVEFKEGKFVFNEAEGNESFDTCWQTIGTIEKHLGFCQWTKSSKFWRAMSIIINHPNFNKEKWFKNLNMLITKVCQKASSLDYINMFKEVHNFRNQTRIEDIAMGQERVD